MSGDAFMSEVYSLRNSLVGAEILKLGLISLSVFDLLPDNLLPEQLINNAVKTIEMNNRIVSLIW